ncbi:MAG: 50S ribosomal protein L6 [Candidatus Diapherotrites archaeon]|nr:50S ribosomal protein L6 [Candidatus Diapherotrites archaeon]
MDEDISTKYPLPEGFEALVEGNLLRVKSGGSENAKKFNSREMTVTVEGKEIIVKPKEDRKKSHSMVNAFIAHVRNMCNGLKNDFEYRLEIVYSHFPMTVAIKGKSVEITNVAGSKKTRIARILGGTSVQVKGKEVIVKGPSKEDTGQTAANIEQVTRVKGKDTRVFQDGIYIVEKAGRKVE